MLVVFFRAIILFSVVFLVIRLMGKRELSKVEPFELAIIVMISDLAATPMQSKDTQIFSGIIPIISLLIVYGLFTLLIKSSNKVESIVCSSPSLVIYNGKLIEEEVNKLGLTIEEIMSMLRGNGIYKIQDTAYAILETNGDLNAVKLEDTTPSIPLNVITNGEYLEDNLKLLKISKEEVNKLLKKKKVEKDDILLGTIDENKQFIYQLKESKK